MREEQGEALKPGLADAVDLGVAGDDVGKPRLERRSQGLLVAALRERARRGHQRRGEDGERERGRHRPLPAQELPDPAGEQEHHERVEREQRERAQQDGSAQIFRFAHSVGLPDRVERGEIERREPIVGRERVDRQQSLGRPVKPRRMIEGRAPAKARRHWARGRRRRPEQAESVKNARRRQHFAAVAGAGAGGIARRHRTGVGHDSLEHLDECAR